MYFTSNSTPPLISFTLYIIMCVCLLAVRYMCSKSKRCFDSSYLQHRSCLFVARWFVYSSVTDGSASVRAVSFVWMGEPSVLMSREDLRLS